MRPKEVIVSDEEGSKSNSAVFSLKATGGPGMELISPVESFNKLFK